ncbi:dephospho-CoA kinase [Neorhodopirellula lusitana]|uniref:dephospho-CoA kinase n=1 Tax=Neorhodopirellula lusitana TaxID=445327 RepID=UPI00384C3899
MNGHPKPHTIGIIGPPCSGKSTVAEQLVRLGGVWINADVIAKDQLEVPEVIDSLVGLLGTSILDDSGRLSRPSIASLVFGEDDASQTRLKQLEAIIHPRTREVIDAEIERAVDSRFIILDVPLLLERDWDSICDEVWCLTISPERHRELLNARGWDLAELERREKRQLPWAQKQSRADWVIENNGTKEELAAKVLERVNSFEQRT